MHLRTLRARSIALPRVRKLTDATSMCPEQMRVRPRTMAGFGCMGCMQSELAGNVPRFAKKWFAQDGHPLSFAEDVACDTEFPNALTPHLQTP